MVEVNILELIRRAAARASSRLRAGSTRGGSKPYIMPTMTDVDEKALAETVGSYSPDLSGVFKVLQAHREAFLDHAMGPGWRDKAKALGAAAIASTKKQDEAEKPAKVTHFVSLCAQPGGCGWACRQAIARGDDMERYWPVSERAELLSP